ncbi:MAG: FecR domain-containing protein [Bacteroidales bacterium]|jgi:ferric-dicitrate binding protein FerR (iron transport regulator)|nr:FecR domain-containing protein [Bacteroidales bacterium]
MEDSVTYHEMLIAKYLLGETSDEEVRELLVWLKASSEHVRTFVDMRRTWLTQQAYNVDDTIDLDEEWKAFSNEVNLDEDTITRKISRSPQRTLLRVAAIALLLIIPSLAYYLYFMQPVKKTLFADNMVTESTLPDGTQVALNKGSVLYYPSIFQGKERKVSLEGEAYFDVTPNENKAFIIDAGKLEIRVLGTSFYVNTETTENTIEVALISGKVALNYNNQKIYLEPGEKATVHKNSGKMTSHEFNDPNLLAWKTHTLQFNDTPLSEIIEVLEKVYKKDIAVMNPELNNCRITATFKEQSLEAILLVLQSTIDVTARPNGNRIELSGTGCQ